MSDIGEDIRAYLLTKTAVTDLVSSRIYPDQPPQKSTTPFIVYDVLDSDKIDSVDGGTINLVSTLLELVCVDATRKSASALDLAVRNTAGLNEYSGTANGRWIDSCIADGARYESEAPLDGSDNHRYGVSRTYRIIHADD